MQREIQTRTKYTLQKTNQKWLATYHHTLTFILLPIITCGITNSIKSNIALSLGLVGALSIVRFRNPVKNPFELVIFFGLITIGIAMAIDYKYGIGLTVILNLVIIVFKFFDNLFKEKGKKIFTFSFEEGNKANILLIKSRAKIESIENHFNLNEYYLNKMDKIYNYELIFESRNELNDLKKEIEGLEEIEDIQVRYGN